MADHENELDEGFPVLGSLAVEVCGTLPICKFCNQFLARKCQGGKTPPNHGMIPDTSAGCK